MSGAIVSCCDDDDDDDDDRGKHYLMHIFLDCILAQVVSRGFSVIVSDLCRMWWCSLRPVDVQLMKNLQGQVNLVPVIAKADTLTSTEMTRLKKQVSDTTHTHMILFYLVQGRNHVFKFWCSRLHNRIWSYNCMYMVLSSVCLCLSVCFYLSSVIFTALWRINMFIITLFVSKLRKTWGFRPNFGGPDPPTPNGCAHDLVSLKVFKMNHADYIPF